MGVLEDVMKALERIPLWKRVSKLPEEVEALEKRVTELEARLSRAKGDQCPKCREMAFTLESSVPMTGALGRLGAMHDQYRCSACGYTDRRTRSQ